MTRERMQPPEAPYEPPRLEEAEEKLFHLIVPELRAHAIQPESFHDYREETTRRDMAHVEKLERKFKDESASDPEYAIGVKRGELFEAIIATQIEESNWMGENAEITVPARYDDIVNGVDLIVGFTEEETHSHLGLAVDATESVRGVDRKFLKIKESIENGTLSLIKYFDSEYFHGTLRQVPRVVIGADRSTTKEVTDLLLYFKMRQRNPAQNAGVSETTRGALQERFRETREKLAHHPLQYQVLLEISAQLESFKRYAERIDKPKPAAAYERVLAIVRRVLKEKREEVGESRYREYEVQIQNDAVYRMILEKAKRFGK